MQIDDLIKEVNVLRLEPDDVLVLRLDRPVTGDAYGRIERALRERLPAGVRAMVLDPGMSLDVVKAESTTPEERLKLAIIAEAGDDGITEDALAAQFEGELARASGDVGLALRRRGYHQTAAGAGEA